MERICVIIVFPLLLKKAAEFAAFLFYVWDTLGQLPQTLLGDIVPEPLLRFAAA